KTTATSTLSTLSLHDALPICRSDSRRHCGGKARHHRTLANAGPIAGPGAMLLRNRFPALPVDALAMFERTIGRCAQSIAAKLPRSGEHTSELQSRENLVCRLL